jgi:hypothetical protein
MNGTSAALIAAASSSRASRHVASCAVNSTSPERVQSAEPICALDGWKTPALSQFSAQVRLVTAQRATVILASVLFLVGISTQFPIRAVRLWLITVAVSLLIFGIIEVLQLPGPPR